jgi:hypothetical protein
VIAAPSYFCVACGTRWAYAEVRLVACCKHCGHGLTRAEPDEGVRPGGPLALPGRAA